MICNDFIFFLCKEATIQVSFQQHLQDSILIVQIAHVFCVCVLGKPKEAKIELFMVYGI